MPRMKYLSDTESKQFDSAPEFNAAERKRFFSVTDGLDAIVGSLKSETNQVCFIISLGYFRATKRFYAHHFRDADVRFVATRLGYFPEMVAVDEYDKSTATRHRKLILEHLGYREFDDKASEELRQHAHALIRAQMAPTLIIARLVEFSKPIRQKCPPLVY